MLQFPSRNSRSFSRRFQWAPTLGGECYKNCRRILVYRTPGFNGHPPLGVNATSAEARAVALSTLAFQWAPTLGGECYSIAPTGTAGVVMSFNGHPPLGVNATVGGAIAAFVATLFQWAPTLGGECYWYKSTSTFEKGSVSMGTHPWG